MLETRTPKLFGSSTRTRTLLAIALLKDTYVQQIAGVLEVSTPTIFKIVEELEADEVIVSKYVGRTRTLSLNPRMFGIGHLEKFLEKYAQSTDMEERVSRIRGRPRRRTKAIQK